MEILNLHFIRPWFLLGIIPLLLIVWRLLRIKHLANNWQQVCDPHLLPALLKQQNTLPQQWPYYLLILAWLTAIIALAGPSWQRLSQTIYQKQQAQIVILDLSPAMAAQDIKPSRIARARFKILDFLKNSHENQIGMVVFAEEAYIVSPLTNDAKTIAALLPQLSPNIMPVGGHNIAAGLKLAHKLLKQAHIQHGEIILITASPVTAKDLSVAAQLKIAGIPVQVLGLGSQQGAPIQTRNGRYLKNARGEIIISKLESRKLRQLATTSGGQYIEFTNTNQDIKQLLAVSQQQTSRMQAARTKDKINIWRDEGHWFILLLLPLVLLPFRRDWLDTI